MKMVYVLLLVLIVGIVFVMTLRSDTVQVLEFGIMTEQYGGNDQHYIEQGYTMQDNGWVKSTSSSVTICNNGKCTKTMYAGVVNYEENGTYVSIDTEIGTDNCEVNYEYCVDKNLYQVHYKTNPTVAETIRFVDGEFYFTFQPFSLNYRNNLDMIEQINITKPVIGTSDENDFIYRNIFGEGINLKYTYYNRIVKEVLIINNRLPQPQEYILDQENITLDIDFLLDYPNNVNIYIEGELWDKQNTRITSSEVDFKDENGTTKFYLPEPYAYDSNNSQIQLEYEFKKTGNKLYAVVKTPFIWLNSTERVYPIFIDPTTEYNFSVQLNITAVDEENVANAIPPVENPPLPGNDITAESALDSDDGSEVTHFGDTNDEVYIEVKVVLNEVLDTITALNYTWNGKSAYINRVTYLYAFNFTDNDWQQLDTTSTSSQTDYSLYANIAYASDYINNSEIFFTTEHTYGNLFTDFVKLEVTYIDNIIPNIGAARKNVSDSININNTVRVNVTVTDENGNETIDNVWGEFSVPNGFTTCSYNISSILIAEYNFSVQNNIIAEKSDAADDDCVGFPLTTYRTCSPYSDVTSDSGLDSSDDSDQSIAITAIDDGYLLIIVNVQETITDITLLNFTWEGRGTDTTGFSSTLSGHIWNISGGAWKVCTNAFDDNAVDEIYQCEATNGLTDHIDSDGNVSFLMYVDAGNTFPTETDFVNLEVAYNGTLIINDTSCNKTFIPYPAATGNCVEIAGGACGDCEDNATCQNCSSANCSFSTSEPVEMLEDFDGSAPADWETWGSEGSGISWESNNILVCVNDDNDDCMEFDGCDGDTIELVTDIDMSGCVAGTGVLNFILDSTGSEDDTDCGNVHFSANSGSSWSADIEFACDEVGDPQFDATPTIAIPDQYLTANFRYRFECEGFSGTGENWGLDNFNISCVGGDVCTGDLNCSYYDNNQTGCDTCNQCEFEYSKTDWYYDWTDTVINGTYNLTKVWANDTYATNTTAIVLGWVVNETEIIPPEDSCSCPAINNDWDVDLSDYCNLTSCDLGTGKLNFTGSGFANCKGEINTTNLGDPEDGTLYIFNDCKINVK